MDVPRLVAELRAAGGDTTAVEVKRGSGGLPESLTKSLSALANRPGGGVIILGLDEGAGFAPVRLQDPNTLRQGLADKARGYIPPVRLVFEDNAMLDGEPLVVATVLECDPSAKPCRHASSGKAYLRGYDGDYELSDLELQGFTTQRSQPMLDRAPVRGAGRSDLDDELVRSWIATARDLAPYGLGRFDDDEMLVRGGVLDRDGTPSKAGLLALGIHPQQWYPRYVVQAAVEPADVADGTRAMDIVTLSGPIPRMLEGAMAWARRNFTRVAFESDDGRVIERPSYPLAAFRELVSNAMVHRDLAPWSEGRAIEVRYGRGRLVVTSPGGLWGITVDRLGSTAVSSARNAGLLTICQHVRSGEGEGRVIEALAQGLPRVHRLLAEAGAPSPRYFDRGLSFTVLSGVVDRIEASSTAAAVIVDLPETQARVFEVLGQAPRTATDIAASTGLRAPNVRRALRALRARGLITVDGGRGRRTFYRRRSAT